VSNTPEHLPVQAAQLANEGVNIATAASYFRVCLLVKYCTGNALGAATSVLHDHVDLTYMGPSTAGHAAKRRGVC
jgi:hypothetical protein